MNILPHDMELLGGRLLQKWQGYHNVSRHSCCRMLLKLLADTWELFGSTLFYCKDQYGTLTHKTGNVWLAVNEEGVALLHGNNMVIIIIIIVARCNVHYLAFSLFLCRRKLFHILIRILLHLAVTVTILCWLLIQDSLKVTVPLQSKLKRLFSQCQNLK